MTEIKSNYKTRFKEHPTEKLMRKPVGVALPVDADNYVRSLPDRAEWLRKAIARQIEEDLKNAG